MAKKNNQPKNLENNAVETEVKEVEVVETQTTKADKKASKKADKQVAEKSSKNVKDNKAKTKNNKQKKEKKSIKKQVSEVWSELKKVSKPSFGKVVKNTCVVIAVVAICTLLLFGVDKLFSLVYNLLLP